MYPEFGIGLGNIGTIKNINSQLFCVYRLILIDVPSHTCILYKQYMISDYGDVGREGLFLSPSPSLLSDNKQITWLTVSENTDHKEWKENEIVIYLSQVPVT